MNRIISPSLLSADFSILKDQIDIVKKAGAQRLHIDCMDGHFVPNFTFGPFIVKAIRKLTDLHLETHLMIYNPSNYFNDFIDAGSDTLIIHIEASSNILRDIKIIKSYNVLAGLAINPDTNIALGLSFGSEILLNGRCLIIGHKFASKILSVTLLLPREDISWYLIGE